MKYIELPEKISILVNLILESKILIVALMAILILTFMFVNKNISKIKYFILMTLSLIAALAMTIITNTKTLFTTFDNIINNVFMNIYFPSVEFYIFMLVFMLFFTLNSIINVKVRKANKINNILMFFITFFLFISFLITIASNNIDIFNKSSIYTNQNAIVLLQLSTSIFVLWLLISLIIYIINVIVDRIELSDVKQENLAYSTNLATEANKDVNKKLYDVILEDDEEKISSNNNLSTNKPLYSESNIELEEDSFIIENPVMDDSTKFSLDEYRVFNRMLKTSMLLNRYKDNITMEDMLNPYTLGEYTDEEYNIYKKMLVNYMS